MDIACFSLDEIERFDWCEAPGIECRTREIVEGPHFLVIPARPVSTAPALYDEAGCLFSPERLRAVAANCLDQRPSDIATAQDNAAVESPVGIRFVDPDPSAWHVLDGDNKRVEIQRLEITLRYRVRTSVVPFKFHHYRDRSTGKEIYKAAIAPISAGDLAGDIILHKVEGEHIEIIFVPRQASA